MSQLIWGGMPVQAISVAARLGIADLVAASPRTIQDLAEATSTHPGTLLRVLRALGGMGIFSEDGAGKVGNTPLSETLRSDYPGSVRALAVLWGTPLFLRPWQELGKVVATGQPAFDQVYREPFFEYLQHQAADAAVFNAAMAGASEADLACVLNAYDFSRFERIADVGGGSGALLHGILSANPNVRGLLYDLPGVVADAAALRTGPIAERCEVIGGSFFKAVPGADAYVLKRIVHDWPDEAALQILTNCRRAIHPGGTLLLVEWVLKPPNAPDFGRFMDLHMLVLLGGRERTESEFRGLLGRAGFDLLRVIPTAGPHSILESKPG
jgi:SAM-dependent methyltransferase